MPRQKNLSLEEVILAKGLLDPERLERAKKESENSKESLQKTLIRLGYLTEELLIPLLEERSGLPYVDLDTYTMDPELIKLIPEAVARRYQLIPLFKIGKILTVAMADPSNYFALDEIRLKAHCDVEAVVSTEEKIRQAIDQHYGTGGSMEALVKSITQRTMDLGDEKLVEEAPIIQLVNLLISQAVRERASDIHIEPETDTLRIRLRIDGVLHEIPAPPKELERAVISRIKVLSKMDIAERRIPQDGRFRVQVDHKEIDLRVSTIPSHHGENVVMRLLDTATVLIGLEELGLPHDAFEPFHHLIHRPHGIILVTGPTGSGKTTTLYACLNKISTLEKNIITIEDPIEYEMEVIRQMQVNPKIGVTFANGLRSILRQDPDIIMVGEIRDVETAEMAIHAALTGHLVFSTLHTNDAPGALTRLMDMGVEPFLIASSVIGIVAQRLVRLICPQCKKSYVPSQELLKTLRLPLGKGPIPPLYRGEGCRFCKETGYKGRTAIFELMVMEEEIRELVIQRASSPKMKDAACRKGMQVLREDGLAKAMAGITSIEEVLRVTQDE
ncbi:MAG: type II/IV secretion system protein [Candidatus Omnitrophica bacterium]|nr:type II/IV secretion system protein [Candidatus Omnitrophota bacterium]